MVACGVLSPLGWLKPWGAAGCGESLATAAAPPGESQCLGSIAWRTAAAASDGASVSDRGGLVQAALLRIGSDDRRGSSRGTIGNECGGTWMAMLTSSLVSRALYARRCAHVLRRCCLSALE